MEFLCFERLVKAFVKTKQKSCESSNTEDLLPPSAEVTGLHHYTLLPPTDEETGLHHYTLLWMQVLGSDLRSS